MFLRRIYDDDLAQAAYLIGCQRTGEAIVIDPERDVDRYIDVATDNELHIVATAETHIHADFLSGSRELAEAAGAHVYVSDEGDAEWKYQWLDQKSGGGSYEHTLLKDGDRFSIGGIDFEVLHTPGHTPEHVSFLITDRGGGATDPIAIATGDFVFVGDLGRPDLLETAAGQTGAMEPSARTLHRSVAKLNALDDYVQVWPAHGAGSACGKALGAVPTSTIGYERRYNTAIQNARRSEQGFVDFILTGQPEPPLYFARMKRDNKLGPGLLSELDVPKRMTLSTFGHVNGKQAAVVDTRSWNEFRDGHLPDSLSFPLEGEFTTRVGSFLTEEEDIYLIVEPRDLHLAVRKLYRIGLDRIRGWLPANELHGELSRMEDVTPGDLDAVITTQSAQLLDVRLRTEYEDGHLDAALNFSHTRLAAHLDEIPIERPLLVYCRTGLRSAAAASYLKRAGYVVLNLAGGIEALNHTNKEEITL